MRKTLILSIACIALIAMNSCKNRNKNKTMTTKEKTTKNKEPVMGLV